MATAVAITITDEMKRKFASTFVRTNNAAAAALQIIDNNPGEALRQSHELMKDPIVVAIIDHIKNEGSDDDRQPTRIDIANQILEKAKECKDAEGYSKLMKLYCDVRGFIEKPGANVEVKVQSSVMVVRDLGSDDEWKMKAANRQRELIANAAN
jgi:hypothetical protein